MTPPTGTIVHEWFERVWNQGQSDAIDDLLAEDAVIHGLQGPNRSDAGGPPEFRRMYAAFRDAFPDLRIDVDACLVDGDQVAFRCHVRGTHTGRGLGFEATGKAVNFQGMGFVRARAGRIVEAWNNFDFQTLYAQLGVDPWRRDA